MNTDETPIKVDLADPASLREALPAVEQRVARQKAVVEAAQGELGYWTSLWSTIHDVLRAMAPGSGSEAPTEQGTLVSPEVPAGGPAKTGEAKSPVTESAPVTGGHDRTGLLELVVEEVNRVGAPTRSRDVTAALRGRGLTDLTADSVSNALYYAATRPEPLLVRVRRGFYGPLPPRNGAQDGGGPE